MNNSNYVRCILIGQKFECVGSGSVVYVHCSRLRSVTFHLQDDGKQSDKMQNSNITYGYHHSNGHYY
jgi:hypothetical protein